MMGATEFKEMVMNHQNFLEDTYKDVYLVYGQKEATTNTKR